MHFSGGVDFNVIITTFRTPQKRKCWRKSALSLASPSRRPSPRPLCLAESPRAVISVFFI